ncbi:hypothetical protein RHSIM_Rhsim12G0205800 [Rhododendron simsii]|uniref:Chromo domain-containing protein n=1 Tax=Rhododendron simsii TaxID=118357 RepID=A0A834G495_RHOSS|nr:hypothetical protein RHSIM_Rhsim12G0205800 [Rhododendron simsii]
MYALDGEQEDQELEQLQDEGEEEPQEQNEELQISINALTGSTSYRTMRIQGNVKKKLIIILIDSGSTHNFLNLEVIKRAGVQTTETDPLPVSVADGTKMISTALCKGFKWEMQGADFQADMRVLQLKGCDMVLGIQWLATLGPVKWDFKNLCMDFTLNGRRHVLRGGKKEVSQVVGPEKMQKLLLKQPQGLLAQVFALQVEEQSEPTSLEVQQLLAKYDGVFQEPKELPPSRAHDHHIPLKPRVEPPNTRPYRYPYFQKTEIEEQVREMLTSGVIQASQKWITKLIGYDYDIVYRSGQENKAADALSRREDSIQETTTLNAISSVATNWMPLIKHSWQQDGYLQQLMADLTHDSATHPGFLLEQGMLTYKGSLVVGDSAELREKIIAEYHNTSVGGHSGIDKTIRRIKRTFYWKGLKKDVQKYISECDTTPFYAVYGQEPPDHNFMNIKTSSVAAVENWAKERATILRMLRENLHSAQQRMKHYADKLRTEREFAVGDWVFLRLQPYRQTSLALQRNMKLAPRFYGPFQVISKIGKVAYKLLLPDTAQIHPVFHVSLLKKKLGTGVVATPTLPPVNEEGNMQIEPVAVLERKMVKRNNRAVVQWLVQWSRSFPEDATWIDYEELVSKFPNFQP